MFFEVGFREKKKKTCKVYNYLVDLGYVSQICN